LPDLKGSATLPLYLLDATHCISLFYDMGLNIQKEREKKTSMENPIPLRNSADEPHSLCDN